MPEPVPGIAPVAVVEDDALLLGFGEILFGNDGEGAEEEIGGVSHDGGAARGDFSEWKHWFERFCKEKKTKG